jgi:hypothetical protein
MKDLIRAGVDVWLANLQIRGGIRHSTVKVSIKSEPCEPSWHRSRLQRALLEQHHGQRLYYDLQVVSERLLLDIL